MESEEGLTQAEKHWMMSASETYVIDSDMEGGGMDSASAYRVQLMGEERYQKKTRSKRYVMDSDSEPCETDSDSERCGLASAAVKCLRDVKPFQLSTDTKERRKDSWSERCTADLDSECLGMASDSVKHKKKAENCQRTSDLKRFWMRLRSASERCWMDSKRKQLDFEYGRCWDSSRRYQLKPARLQFGSGRYRGDFQKHRYNFERHRVDSDSEKCQTDSENERHQNEFESERHLMEVEREQCLTQIEDKILQMNEERERRLIESDSEKECRIAFDSERHRLESENEAQRLGARRKDNRPQGFWRPVFLPPSPVHQKETEEQRSVQKIDGRDVSRIQLVRYLSDDKSVRFKKVSPTLNDKQDPQQKLKENYSHNLPSDSDASMDNKHRSITRRKISVRKSRRKDYRYPQSSQSSGSQINSVLPLSAEGHTPKASPPVCHTTSMSPRSAVSSKTLRNSTHSLDTGVKICSRCFVEINNSSFHKCLKSFYDDSDPDSPLHPQVPLDSKYSLSLKSVRHHKTSRNSPLFRSLDPKQPVGIRCPLHRDESKYSLGSTSYLHCESCSALQNLKGSTVTRTFLINPQNTISRRSTPGPDNIINTSSVTGPEDGDKFNLAAKLKDEANRDNESKCVGYTNLKDEANAKDESLPKDETDLEEETNSENETNPEDETDSEDEDSPKDKKDPKDKSDPDDTDPKDDSNAENDDDTNSGADPSGDADPTSGANSNNDGDPNNGTDPTSEPDPDTDRATNNDANSERSTDPDGETHTRSDNGAHIDSGVDQDYTADFKNGTNPSYISECQNGKGLDCIPGSKNDAGPSNDTGTGNDICPHNGTGPNCGSGPNNGLVSNNNEPGHNSPGPNNTNPGPPKSLDSSYTARPSNAISPDNSADPNYDTRPTSTAGHNYSPVPNYYSDLDYVPEFTHEAGSSFVVNPNYIARSSYVAKLSSSASIVNATDPSNDTNCSGVISPSYTASTNYASDDNHVLVFTHATGSNFVINPVYNAINAHNSSSIGNIHNLSKPKLEISSSFSVSHTVYGNSSTFDVGTIYSSNPDNLSTSKFSDPSKLGRNYTIFDDHTFGAHLKDSAGSKKSSSFKHATESKDVLDANESGFLKNFSRIQNPIGIKDPARLNFHTKPNILLHSFGIIIEAEPADVVKFAISSGAMNQFFKLNLQTGSRQNVGP
uniref:Uncharacterized protein n=1 Tax=Loxodonta africana TaxID=9785 RepID=G3U079_LOXAF